MKYNPKFADEVAALRGLADVHPAAPEQAIQGWLALVCDLEKALCSLVGMAGATFQPAAGAAGELTGLLMVRAFHAAGEARSRGGAAGGGAAGGGAAGGGAAGRGGGSGHASSGRTKVIIPDSAHGTNPASVTLAGYEAVTVPSDTRGCVDLAALREAIAGDVAAVMLTNPNTLGLFEEDIAEIARLAHNRGALLYYDGANLNAILGMVRPGDMGFDVVHLNLHKTFATPHGGGGPGSGPVLVSERLLDFLPGPRPALMGDGERYGWMVPERSIGRMHSWHGNALVVARALAYVLYNGSSGLRKVSNLAVLNANWIRKRLESSYQVPFDRPCMHEVVISAEKLKSDRGLSALDVAKRLLEEGFHAPTIYFPLIVREALMIEPTETESLQTLQALAEALERIASGTVERDAKPAPRTTPVGRVDEARAARRLEITG